MTEGDGEEGWADPPQSFDNDGEGEHSAPESESYAAAAAASQSIPGSLDPCLVCMANIFESPSFTLDQLKQSVDHLPDPALLERSSSNPVVGHAAPASGNPIPTQIGRAHV